jgi:hypothetical protein
VNQLKIQIWHLYDGGEAAFASGAAQRYIRLPEAISTRFRSHRASQHDSTLFFVRDSEQERAFLEMAAAHGLPLSLLRFGKWDERNIDGYRQYRMFSTTAYSEVLGDPEGLFEGQDDCDWPPLPGAVNSYCASGKRQLRKLVTPKRYTFPKQDVFFLAPNIRCDESDVDLGVSRRFRDICIDAGLTGVKFVPILPGKVDWIPAELTIDGNRPLLPVFSYAALSGIFIDDGEAHACQRTNGPTES